MEKHIAHLEALEQEAKELVASLSPGEHATLVTLSGELGAGKTTFTQAIARALGVTDIVTSPTFVLEKMYELTGMPFKRLVHIDAYRLTAGNDLAPLAFHTLYKEPDNLIVLEWPQRVVDALPVADVAITLVPSPDGSRTFTYA